MEKSSLPCTTALIQIRFRQCQHGPGVAAAAAAANRGLLSLPNPTRPPTPAALSATESLLFRVSGCAPCAARPCRAGILGCLRHQLAPTHATSPQSTRRIVTSKHTAPRIDIDIDGRLAIRGS